MKIDSLLAAAEEEPHKKPDEGKKRGRGFMDSIFPAYLSLYRKNYSQQDIYEWLAEHTDNLPDLESFKVGMSMRYTKYQKQAIVRASK